MASLRTPTHRGAEAEKVKCVARIREAVEEDTGIGNLGNSSDDGGHAARHVPNVYCEAGKGARERDAAGSDHRAPGARSGSAVRLIQDISGWVQVRRMTKAAARAWKLGKLPYVPSANEAVARARKAARREHARAHTRASEVDLHTQCLVRELRFLSDSLPPTSCLHPFEHAALDLSLDGGQDEYIGAINCINEMKSTVLSSGRSGAASTKHARSKKTATSLRDYAIKHVQNELLSCSSQLEFVKRCVMRLKQVPLPQPDEPLAALVGAPNVGKSSLVRSLSTGNPTVQNYPFTTRGFLLGHMHLLPEQQRSLSLQIADTPGLLHREHGDERNRLERMTLAVLAHLPSVAVFVLDLTGRSSCGMSVAQQLSIRSEIKNQFPHKRWVDVFSKADLAPKEVQSALERADVLLEKNGVASSDEAEDLRAASNAIEQLSACAHFVSVGATPASKDETSFEANEYEGLAQVQESIERELLQELADLHVEQHDAQERESRSDDEQSCESLDGDKHLDSSTDRQSDAEDAVSLGENTHPLHEESTEDATRYESASLHTQKLASRMRQTIAERCHDR